MNVKLKKILVCFMSVVMVMSMSITAFAGLGVPTKTWNLKKSGRYTFSGEAGRSDLYSDYLFTGTTRVRIRVNNYSDEQLAVKLFEKSAWFFCETKAYIPADGITIWKYSGLESNKKYYLQFYAPSDFSGYIEAY